MSAVLYRVILILAESSLRPPLSGRRKATTLRAGEGSMTQTLGIFTTLRYVDSSLRPASAGLVQNDTTGGIYYTLPSFLVVLQFDGHCERSEAILNVNGDCPAVRDPFGTSAKSASQ